MASETRVGELPAETVARLFSKAWEVRTNAYVIGPTRVGCAVLDQDGGIHVGCNVEHRFRSHDVHAEVNALSSMVTAGGKKVFAVAIAAERERFTPCGACMDWIMEFADDDCVVLAQSRINGPIQAYTARQLMPYYPH